MPVRRAIALIGEMGSGKTFYGRKLAEYLKDFYGKFFFYAFSDPLKEIINKFSERTGIPIPISRETMTSLPEALFKSIGDDVLAREILRRHNHDSSRTIGRSLSIIDGIRFQNDLNMLSKLWLNWHNHTERCHIIYVTAPIEIRFERCRLRNEKAGEDKLTLDKFKQQHELYTERNIPHLARSAHHVFINDGDESKIVEDVDRVIEKFYLRV